MANPPKIESYSMGQIVIDGKSYRRDVIIRPNGVLPEWWREEGHSLVMEDLHAIIDPPPRVLIIGTGLYGRLQVPDDTMRELEGLGVEVITHPTEEACEKYNQIRVEGGVVAALHLTC